VITDIPKMLNIGFSGKFFGQSGMAGLGWLTFAM